MSTLIVYFSREGNNYVNGAIKNLKVGNTEVIANMIQEITGGDLFKLDPVKKYALDYTECTNEAKDELRANARPEAKAYPDVSKYDVIYLGYPNWWGTMPMCVFTFLERSDFAGKIIRPFCTHEGSGMGRTESDIKRVCSGAKVERGLAVHGADASQSRALVENWLKNNN
ncbi:MAG: flavodoxin [Synergistaceae bacterium]|nr:flavodoxin [Synergistaceae bacterium]